MRFQKVGGMKILLYELFSFFFVLLMDEGSTKADIQDRKKVIPQNSFQLAKFKRAHV